MRVSLHKMVIPAATQTGEQWCGRIPAKISRLIYRVKNKLPRYARYRVGGLWDYNRLRGLGIKQRTDITSPLLKGISQPLLQFGMFEFPIRSDLIDLQIMVLHQ